MARWSQSQYQEVLRRGRMDGEYHSHSARHIESQLLSSHLELKRLRDCCERITSGHTPLRHDLSSGDVFFVTVECVSPLLIDYGLTKRVRSNHYLGELSRVALSHDYVVVTIKRRIAQASPCYGLRGETVVNQDVAVLRLKKDWNPGYVAAYLISSFGQQLADREKTEQMNPYLPVGKLGNLLIPRIGTDIQDAVDLLVKQRFASLAASEKAYSDAEQLLELELGLDRVTFQKPVGYTARFSDLETSHRSDAQYYQTRFSQLIDHISTFPLARVRNIRISNRRGLQPVYVESGPVDVINSQHLGPRHIDYEGLEKTSATAFASAPEAHIQRDDLLIYTTGAYIGRTNVYLSDAPAMASNHVNLLRLKPGIDAAYLALVFQSVVGQFQTLKHARGSAQAELYPIDIDRFVVPLLDAHKQERIGSLIRESLAMRRESRKLLEQAKTRVEQLIKEALQP
jgi:hypothetical protein